MSYSFINPCYMCSKGNNSSMGLSKGTCKDAEKVQEAITKIHLSTYDEGHQGRGTIVLACCRQNTDK